MHHCSHTLPADIHDNFDNERVGGLTNLKPHVDCISWHVDVQGSFKMTTNL
jgi:hypothetical protein